LAHGAQASFGAQAYPRAHGQDAIHISVLLGGKKIVSLPPKKFSSTKKSIKQKNE
jgi:hypothetical protein